MNVSEKELFLLHFEKMCRLCLSHDLKVIGIFNKSDDNDISLRDKIKEFVTLEVLENDGLPQNVCQLCCEKLSDWHNFKINCKKSDTLLHNYFSIKTSASSDQVSSLGRQNSLLPTTDEVKCEEDEETNMVLCSDIKIEENDASQDELFSESDEKPLIEVKTSRGNVKKKKKEEIELKKLKKDGTKKMSARGRAPKAKPLCLVCHQKFSRFVELIDHQNKVHNLNMSECEVKNDSHVEESKADAFAIFRCHLCKKEFSGREDLRNHCKSVHNTKVIQPYPCSHCDRQFPAWGLLVVHERKHTGEKPYSCDVCGKQNFISQTSLRRHKLMHLKVYSCQECGRDFNCDSALKAHIRCKHTNEKPYLCNICGRSFSLSAILMAHMTSHSSERKYICDVCGFASKTSGNHYRHKNTHKTGGTKSFHCETCGKSFDTKLKLSSHQIIHRPVRPHVCKVCGKAFLYNNKLERHVLLVHAKERPFPCSLCGKKLASKFGLGIHLKTHNRNNESVKVEVEIHEPQTG